MATITFHVQRSHSPNDTVLYDEQTQTESELYPPYKKFTSSRLVEIPPDLNGTGQVLVDQYRDCVLYYLKNPDKTQLSQFKNEIRTSLQKNILFQAKVFGSDTPDIDTLPASTFTDFTVSLFLTIHHDSMTMVSATNYIVFSEPLSKNTSLCKNYLNHGLLPPGVFDDLRRQGLTWYDGGLICEVTDNRCEDGKSFRIHLRVNPQDIAQLGADFEEEYLFARHPLLCLDPDIQVARLRRNIEQDHNRFIPHVPYQSLAQKLQNLHPQKFIKRTPPPEPPAPSIEDLRRQFHEKLMSFDPLK